MQLELQLRIVDDCGEIVACDEVLRVHKEANQLETIGLSLAEAKTLLNRTQEYLVAAQAEDYVARHRQCPLCHRRRPSKGSSTIRFRTLFGTIQVPSHRLYQCRCRQGLAKTLSPLTELFTEHAAPELVYLETKWASQVSFGLAAELLKDALPVSTTTNPATIRNDLHRFALRHDSELDEEKRRFIEGCPAQWRNLPPPEGPMVVGLDGGYVRNWDDKRTHFEVIAGKSVPKDRDDRFFGFAHTHDAKPKRRLYEVLRSQGLTMNQDVTFMTDGGDAIWALTSELSPCSDAVLDWFHLAMRFTVLGQFAKGLAHHDEAEGSDVEFRLTRIKWRLWNGDTSEALERLDDLAEYLHNCMASYDGLRKFTRITRELASYVANNAESIPHYGERYRNGERISTAFVESAVNVVIDKRMSKRQQMQWTKRGAHLLLQARSQTLNGTLRQTFIERYPSMAANDATATVAEAA